MSRWQAAGGRIAYSAAALYLVIAGAGLIVVFATLLALGGFFVTSRFPRLRRRVFGYPVRNGRAEFAAAEFAFGTTMVGAATAIALLGSVT